MAFDFPDLLPFPLGVHSTWAGGKKGEGEGGSGCAELHVALSKPIGFNTRARVGVCEQMKKRGEGGGGDGDVVELRTGFNHANIHEFEDFKSW